MSFAEALPSHSIECSNLKPGEVSTGTTIVALPFAGGVVVGADSRTSTGSYVAVRTSDKIACLSEHIYACRSGSAADTQALTDYIRYYLQQLKIETGRPVRVKSAAHLLQKLVYQNKDNLMAGMIVAGWDPVEGPAIYSIALGGACIKVPFAFSGSGSTYITGLLDSEFREDMTQGEARALIKKALAHAMARDGSSGGIIRTVVITSEGTDRDYTSDLPYGPVSY